MSIVYKDIDTYTPKSSIAGTEKIPVSSSEYITPNQITAALTKGNGKLFYGTCSTNGATAAKVVTCDSFTSADLAPGTLIIVKFDNANTAAVADLTMSVNGTTALGVRKLDGTSITFLSAAGEIRAFPTLFICSGTYWIQANTDQDTTYATITSSEIDTGTGTGKRVVSASVLRSNFYTEDEVDAFFTNRPTIIHLTDESDMPAVPDANTVYMIDE